MVPSLDLIRRTRETEVAYTISRMRILERLPGNPVGIACREVDDSLWALMARAIPSPSFNRVTGLRGGHERHIAPLVAWYRERGVAGRFELVPGESGAGPARELARLGYHHSDHHVAAIGDAEPPASGNETPSVEAVTTGPQLEAYLDAYVAGWGVPPEHRERFKANVRPWLGEPGWSLYLARVDGHPAAAGTLYLRDRVGYFADAATDPAFRGRGLQTALLQRRWREAAAAGVDFVCSGASFLSSSHRNLERLGMRILFIRSIWIPLPELSKETNP
ncbi:MAG TPA: GNAT family N-acetyltransferase [Stellaceae bacterium]|nr:GNAT family N-acetyltransferase [Stellaceae bacterium]